MSIRRQSFTGFASGLDEVLGMSQKDGAFFITQQTEVTKITDENGDGRADRFDTLSDAWGFRDYHEFAFGSKLDSQGKYLGRAMSFKILSLLQSVSRLVLENHAGWKNDSCLQWNS